MRHKFKGLMIRDQTDLEDMERQAMFYIVANTSLYDRADKIYDFADHSININCIETGAWSGGELKMIHVAFNLYNNYPSPYSLLETFASLDYENQEIVFEAIRIKTQQKQRREI